MNVHFGLLNYGVLGVYLAAMLAIGLYFARSQETTEDYFLAGRRMPWLPVAMSMFASLTSAVTFLVLPSAAYSENVSMLVVCLVSPLLAPVLVFVLYPVYRRLHVTTSYEYIGRRFGDSARYAVSALFVLARLGWMGTVIYAPALVLSVATGIPLFVAIPLMGLMATAYTVMGGLSAVLWTDVAQFVILVGGAVWTAVSLVTTVPGGAAAILRTAAESGHLHVVSWHLSLFEMSGLVVGVSFFLQMMQDYGTDQVTVQRILAIRDARGVAKATFFNAMTDFCMIALLLFIGLGLLAFFTIHGVPPGSPKADSLLPYYIMTNLPPGVSGLVISAIFAAAMSSMDSGINSLATVIEHDFVRRLSRRPADERGVVRQARLLTLGLGLAATGIAFGVSGIGSIVESFATFMSLFNAPVLALFLLGMFFKRTTFGGWLLGVVVAIPVTYWLQRAVGVHWIYFFPYSFFITFGIGLIAGIVRPGAPAVKP